MTLQEEMNVSMAKKGSMSSKIHNPSSRSKETSETVTRLGDSIGLDRVRSPMQRS